MNHPHAALQPMTTPQIPSPVLSTPRVATPRDLVTPLTSDYFTGNKSLDFGNTATDSWSVSELCGISIAESSRFFETVKRERPFASWKEISLPFLADDACRRISMPGVRLCRVDLRFALYALQLAAPHQRLDGALTNK